MPVNAVKGQQAIIDAQRVTLDDQAHRIAGLEAALADIRALLTNESIDTSQACRATEVNGPIRRRDNS